MGVLVGDLGCAITGWNRNTPFEVKITKAFIFMLSLACIAVGKQPMGEPVAYHAIYEISVESTPFTVSFDWSEYDGTTWNEGFGFHKERFMTDYSFARQLSPKWAVIIRLPRSFFNNPSPIPEVLLVCPSDTTLLRCYKSPEQGKPIDGLFMVSKFALSTEPGKKVEGKMSAAERQLIRGIAEGKYATLYGDSYEKSQWEQSPELNQRLGELHATTLLGQPAVKSKLIAGSLSGFYEFRSKYIWNGKRGVMKPTRIYFVCEGGIWSESSAPVAVYKRDQFLHPFRVFASFPAQHKGLKFNQEANSLYYDVDTGRLTFLQPRVLDSLTEWVFENP